MVPFSGMITHDGTITFTHSDGRIHNVLPSHGSYKQVKDVLRKISRETDEAKIDAMRDELVALSQPANIVKRSTGGRVTVVANRVLYEGKEVKSFLAERILWMLSEGFDAAPMLAFLENVKQNPSNRAVDELYRFMEANKMGITRTGMILAYKRVSADFLDIYTGKLDNSVGKRVIMPRNEVNDNPNETCSHGLHVCSMEYLPSYRGAAGARVVICEIHPKDVVSVPIEYHNAKMRVCEYLVLEEVTDKEDVLAATPVWGDPLNDAGSDEEWQTWPKDNVDAADEASAPVDNLEGLVGFTAPDAPAEPTTTLFDDMRNFTHDVVSGFNIPSTFASMREVAGSLYAKIAEEVAEPNNTFDFTAFVAETRARTINVIQASLMQAGRRPTLPDTLASLGADPIDVARVVDMLEKAHGVKTTRYAIDRRTTVGEIVDMFVRLKS